MNAKRRFNEHQLWIFELPYSNRLVIDCLNRQGRQLVAAAYLSDFGIHQIFCAESAYRYPFFVHDIIGSSRCLQKKHTSNVIVLIYSTNIKVGVLAYETKIIDYKTTMPTGVSQQSLTSCPLCILFPFMYIAVL